MKESPTAEACGCVKACEPEKLQRGEVCVNTIDRTPTPSPYDDPQGRINLLEAALRKYLPLAKALILTSNEASFSEKDKWLSEIVSIETVIG